jgi:hypothetical protein
MSRAYCAGCNRRIFPYRVGWFCSDACDAHAHLNSAVATLLAAIADAARTAHSEQAA